MCVLLEGSGAVLWAGKREIFAQMANEEGRDSQDFGAWDEPQQFLMST